MYPTVLQFFKIISARTIVVDTKIAFESSSLFTVFESTDVEYSLEPNFGPYSGLVSPFPNSIFYAFYLFLHTIALLMSTSMLETEIFL